MILVDTSVWVDFFRGSNSIQRGALHGLIEDEDDICTTEIIITEILQGIKSDGDFDDIKEYLLDLPIFSANGIETYLKAAGIYRACRKKGKTVRKTVDCIIASVAIENGLILLHKDNDFDQIAACAALRVFKG